MTTTRDVAERFALLCKEGKDAQAGAEFWSPDVVSIEAMGPKPISTGLEQMKAKHAWWAENFEVHAMRTTGPWVNGDQFTLQFWIDCTEKDRDVRWQMDEIALYTVRDGKVVEERFFGAPMPEQA